MKFPKCRTVKSVLAASALALAAPIFSIAAPVVFTAVDSIQAEVDAFRAALGDPNNGNSPGPLTSGRREINWDGGGSTATAVVGNPFAGFQATRGALFTTPGTGFVQAPADGLATTFSNPTYSSFLAFSPVRLFSPIDSNITDATFTGPGGLVPATVSGFGVVFSDVDEANSATLEFFDLAGNPIGGLYSALTFDGGLSFLGVQFDAGERIGRVRITSGNVVPGVDDGPGSDVVMMDDFLYAEPQAIPEPATLILLSAGLGAFALARRYKTATGRRQ